MGNDLMGLLLDVVVLMLLGTTIFYVIRLTKGLHDFKKHRHEFDSVIANLLSSIDQADHSVRMLKKASSEEAGHLEASITEAKALSDELRIINEAGESMAKRLEKLAETNRKIIQPSHPKIKMGAVSEKSSRRSQRRDGKKISSPVYHRELNVQATRAATSESHADPELNDDSYDSTLKRVIKDPSAPAQKDDFPSFMIKDKEYEDLSSLESRLDSSVSNDGSDTAEEDVMPENLQSQAERELLAALRNNKKNISNRGQ